MARGATARTQTADEGATKAFLRQVFDALPLGVVVVDADGRVVLYNRYEEALAGRSRQDVVGRDFFRDVAPCLEVKSLGTYFFDHIPGRPFSKSLYFEFRIPDIAEPRDVRVQLSSIEVEGARHGLIIVQDVSAERTLDRLKSALSNFLIHDLKNPLAAVIVNLERFERVEAVRHDVRLHSAVRRTRGVALRLRSMISGLLDVSRLETNEMPLRRVSADVKQLVRAVASIASDVAEARGMRVETDFPSHAILAVIDEDLVRRAVENLADNAVRHAAERGTLRIGVRDDHDHVVIDVFDDGPGIPAELRDQIFDKYARIEAGDASREFNRGLGLTFVRLVARAHGGDVTVEGPSVGGSLFRLRLPKEPRKR